MGRAAGLKSGIAIPVQQQCSVLRHFIDTTCLTLWRTQSQWQGLHWLHPKTDLLLHKYRMRCKTHSQCKQRKPYRNLLGFRQ